MEEPANVPATTTTAPTDGQSLDVAARLRIHGCPECGIAFALPAQLHLHRVEHKQPIHCPNGHAHVPGFDAGRLTTESIMLLAELGQARHELGVAQRQLAACRPPDGGAVDDKELKRRSRILAERAELAPFGRRVCTFCGKGIDAGGLWKHIKNRHAEEVRERPRAAFD